MLEWFSHLGPDKICSTASSNIPSCESFLWANIEIGKNCLGSLDTPSSMDLRAHFSYLLTAVHRHFWLLSDSSWNLNTQFLPVFLEVILLSCHWQWGISHLKWTAILLWLSTKEFFSQIWKKIKALVLITDIQGLIHIMIALSTILCRGTPHAIIDLCTDVQRWNGFTSNALNSSPLNLMWRSQSFYVYRGVIHIDKNSSHCL